MSELEHAPIDVSGRAFTRPVRVDTSKPGTRVTALNDDGATLARDVHMTPTLTVAGDFGPNKMRELPIGSTMKPERNYPTHSGLFGTFDNKKLNPKLTVEIPGRPGETMPAMVTEHASTPHWRIRSYMSPETVAEIQAKEVAGRLANARTLLRGHPELFRAGQQQSNSTLIPYETVLKDLDNVQPRRLFKMVGKPIARPKSVVRATDAAPSGTGEFDHALRELDLNRPQYFFSKYLQALSKKYGVDVKTLETYLRQDANKLPATW